MNSRVIRYYDECMSEYNLGWTGKKDLAIHYGFWEPGIKSHGDALLNMNRVLADRAKIKPTDSVLDAGCGIGGSSIWIARNLGARVIGITISQKQVSIAKKLAEENMVGHLVRFYRRDYLKTGFKRNSFDVVWGLESVCYAGDKWDFIKEAYRVLKPGGRLIMADGFLTKSSYKQDEKELMNKWKEGWVVPNLAEVSRFRKYLESAGFRKIVYMDIRDNVMPSSVRMYRMCLAASVPWRIMNLIGIKSRIQVNHVLSGIHQYKILKNGLGTYGIFYAEK